MLALLGKHYIIEHFVNDYKSRREHLIYQSYVTDCLRALCRSDAPRLIELIEPQRQQVVETRTPEQIFDDIFKGITK